MFEVPGVLEAAGDPGDVVIADERQRHERVQKFVVPHQGPVEFVEVSVVDTAPDRLPQFVLGHRVEAAVAHPRRIVTVDDLADEPRVGERGANAGEHLGPEPVGHRVGRIETPAVGAATEPVRHHVDRVVDDLGVVVIERDQFAVALEGVEVVAPLTEPRRVCEVGGDVVEDAVEEHT